MTTIRNKTRRAVRAVVEFWDVFSHDFFDHYHPERHYMRGPGPKWRAKHPQS